MSGPRLKRIEVEMVGDVAVVRFKEKRILDHDTIVITGQQLHALCDDQGQKNVVVNFTGVEYMSSNFLSPEGLGGLKSRISKSSGKLVLCHVDPCIFEVFEITQVNKLYTFEKTQPLALQHFG